MSKDNNELDEILTTLAERVAVEAQQLKIDAIDYPLYIGRRDGIVKAIKTELDQYYEDFYRNKIPKKDNRSNAIKGVDEGIQIGWNMAIDEMTAQFNSKGDSDAKNN